VTTQPTGPAANFCAPRTLSYGAAPIAGTIGSAGTAGCYRFDGAAGDKVRIRLIPTGGTLDPLATTARPDGGVRCSSTQNEATCVLDATGRHSITVTDAAGTKTGHYAISIQRLNDPVGCGTALTWGGTAVTGTLTAAGDSACHRFTAAAGDRIRINPQSATPGVNPATELLRPDGTPLCGMNSGPLTCTANVGGTYTLLVRDPLPGGYGVSIQRLSNPVGCPWLGGYNPPTAGTLNVPGTMRCYRASGDDGDPLRVRLVATSGAIIPTAEVLDPDGTPRCAPTALDDSTCTLDADSDDHLILVRDSGVVAGPGGFTIDVMLLGEAIGCPSLSFGALPASDGIGVGEHNCHRFTATAGDRVRVRIDPREGATLRPRWELVRPDGSISCSAQTEEFTCPVPVSGTQTIVVRDDSPGTRTGSYDIMVQRLNDPVGCATAAFGPGSEEGELVPAETDCLRFDGEAGDRIRFRAIPGNFRDPLAEVISPDGTTQCSRTAAANVTCLLDSTGTHTLLVHTAAGEWFGTYWWTLQRLNDPVGCGTLTSNTPAVVGNVGMVAMPCWRFVGEAGETVQFKINDLWGEWRPYMEFVGPDGRPIGAHSGTVTSFDIYRRLYDTGWQTVFLRDDGRGLDTGQYDIRFVR
jgi:hypothetical protein